jgi:hypothetical protein
VYAREALGDDDLEAQIARCDGCVLTTGTLAIIVARNDDVLEYMRGVARPVMAPVTPD